VGVPPFYEFVACGQLQDRLDEQVIRRVASGFSSKEGDRVVGGSFPVVGECSVAVVEEDVSGELVTIRPVM
jgi:hypothetical protein